METFFMGLLLFLRDKIYYINDESIVFWCKQKKDGYLRQLNSSVSFYISYIEITNTL